MNKHINYSRRTFIKFSAITGAGLMLNPFFSFGKGSSIKDNYFINGMIPVCLLLQTAILIQKAKFVSQNIKLALDFSIYETKQSNFAFAGLLQHEWTVISETSFKDLPIEKLAFKTGIIVSNIANEYFSKIYSDCGQKQIHELRLYHIAYLIKNISNIDIKQTTKEELTKYFRTLTSPMITRTHTLRPDRDNGMDWIVQMTKWNRDYYAYSEELAATITAPDPIKENNYIKKNNFMDLLDKSIRYAIEENEFTALDKINDNKSLYGKALYESVKQIYDSFK